jgi:hypothetical protein
LSDFGTLTLDLSLTPTQILTLTLTLTQDGKLYGVYVVKDRWERPVLLFKNPWKVCRGRGRVSMSVRNRVRVRDRWARPVLLFKNPWKVSLTPTLNINLIQTSNPNLEP